MKAIFLDRDGVINEYPGDLKYVTSPQEFSFLPNVGSALRKFIKRGYSLYVISNQAGVSKGIYPKENLDKITKKMVEELGRQGAVISGVYYCTHRTEDNCTCRKPKTGLIDKAIKDNELGANKIDIAKSYFIGDTIRDIQTGKSAGLKTILVFSGKEKPENKNCWEILPDFTASDLNEAADIILRE